MVRSPEPGLFQRYIPGRLNCQVNAVHRIYFFYLH